VNKILIGNKSDWTDKKAVTESQGRELAGELGIKFMETSAKVNEGVEEAFFTLARCVPSLSCADRIIQAPAGISRPDLLIRRRPMAGKGLELERAPFVLDSPQQRAILDAVHNSCNFMMTIPPTILIRK
jgi:hypothetical protein